MKTILVLSGCVVITTLVATVSAQTTTTDPRTGNVTTTEPSDKYGPGGAHETVSDNKYRLIRETYKDKNGKRRKVTVFLKGGTTMTGYYDKNEKLVVQVKHTPRGDFYKDPHNANVDPKEGKALVEKMENTPSSITGTFLRPPGIDVGNVNSSAVGTLNPANLGQGGIVSPVGHGTTGTGGGSSRSSARFKEEIKPMDKASEAILALKPVTFRYKKELDANGIVQFGLVAEEVEKVNPALVTRDAEGQLYGVRYDAVNAMLLNEFLKEHSKVEEQEATIAKQQKQIEALTTGLQKVNDQLELRKPAPQKVANDQ